MSGKAKIKEKICPKCREIFRGSKYEIYCNKCLGKSEIKEYSALNQGTKNLPEYTRSPEPVVFNEKRREI